MSPSLITFGGMSKPFTVAIIQDSASNDAAATVAATIERVHDAARRGAQIICLKELFNAPYFCKSQKCERFDLAFRKEILGLAGIADLLNHLGSELEPLAGAMKGLVFLMEQAFHNARLIMFPLIDYC